VARGEKPVPRGVTSADSQASPAALRARAAGQAGVASAVRQRAVPGQGAWTALDAPASVAVSRR